MTVDRVALLTAAIKFALNGIAVVPVKTDGSKAPGLSSWKQYQDARPANSVVGGWFDIGKRTTDGVGVLTGAISNLEMLEAEGRAITEGTWDAFLQLCRDNDAGDLIDRVMAGYTETTPSGGIHVLYRLADGTPRRNTRLASRPSTAAELAENPHARIKVLLETRGEGGFVVVAPSGGRTHDTGNAWTIVAGGPDTIATITEAERDQLHALASMLDASPVIGTRDTERAPTPAGDIDGVRPGDDFNARADWRDILEPHGWKRLGHIGAGWAWRRPGKDGRGISATTGTRGDADCLYVFSSSTDFDTERPLTKLFVYAHYEHGGDMSAAAKALYEQGYGERGRVDDFSELIGFRDDDPAPTPRGATPTAPVATSIDDPPAAPIAPETPVGQVDGTAAPDTVPEQFPPSVGDPEQTTTGVKEAVPATQHANAVRLLNEYGHLIRFNVSAERWLAWDGALWREQAPDGGIVYQYAIESALTLPEVSKADRQAKKSALSAAGIAACLRIAQTTPAVRVVFDDLDARPWELSTPSGTVDLRTGQLTAPLPSHLHTKATTCAPDWDADRSAWLAFLDVTFQGDTELIDWMQRLLGYACVGEVREHILPVFHGQGANGKSVLLEALLGVIGDYGVTMPARFLVVGGEQTPDKAKLIGKRVAVAIETNAGERFNEALVKELTGGDRLTGRMLYRNYVDWTPTHTIFLATNARIDVPSGGTSVWRRLREIPFDHEMPVAERIEGLGGQLASEHGPAVLSWIVDGAVAYGRDGLTEPPAVVAATHDYERSTDSIGRFFAEEIIVGGAPMVKVRVGDVRARYEAYCREMGDAPASAKAFGTALRKRFDVETTKSGSTRFYVGIRLNDLEADGSEPSEADPVQEFLL
jgi:putative DNA primase/helicase